MTLKSHWMKDSKLPRFPKLTKNLEVDVVVIGAGMTGITAAYLLKKAGRKVALLERDRCCQVDTGHTTAHLTYVTDQRLSELVKLFGKDHAQAAWDAGQAALTQIRAICTKGNIDCELRSVPGYLHAPWKNSDKDETQSLKEDAALAIELGFEAKYMDSIPFARRPGIRFANQAKFHPLHYLAALVEQIPGGGCHVFERSEVTEFQEEPLSVKVNDRTVSCAYLVFATHVPLMGNTGLLSAALFQTKLASYSSYAVGAKLPKGTVEEAIFSDTSDPYYYLRFDRHPKWDYAIFGGEDHKTGQEPNTEDCFERLKQQLLAILPAAKIQSQWTGQVVETNDGLPLIGETAENQFVATGFAGNGMTFGTLAAMMAADAALGRKNPWKDLFHVKRKKLGAAWDYLKENIDYPYYYLKDKLTSGNSAELDSIEPGQGKVLKLDGQRVAAYRDASGKLHKRSASCTHMGCIVHWNQVDSTWDCPCHGSRYQANGDVLAGPAETPLEVIEDNKDK